MKVARAVQMEIVMLFVKRGRGWIMSGAIHNSTRMTDSIKLQYARYLE